MSTEYGLLIRNGLLYDGSGGPIVAGDIAVFRRSLAGAGRGLPEIQRPPTRV
jgi:N-acyl-D-aspartate/D-glutamate deacylase